MIVAHRLFLIKAYCICNILSTTFSYYLSIISTKAGTPCFHSVPAFFAFTGSVYLLHQSTYSLVTPHRFARLLFGKTSQNWCRCGVVPQMPSEICLKFHRICVLILFFTGRWASSSGLSPTQFRSHPYSWATPYFAFFNQIKSLVYL